MASNRSLFKGSTNAKRKISYNFFFFIANREHIRKAEASLMTDENNKISENR